MLERLRPMAFLGAPVGPLRGLVYRMDRTVDARRIAQELCRESYGSSKGAITILNTVIPNTIAYREAATARVPVHCWEPHRQGPTPSARNAMMALVCELFPHLAIGTQAGNGLTV
jgi:chromosome partitioning related protein ParA